MSRKTTFKAIYKSKWENGVEIQAEVFVDDERGQILTDIPMDPEDNGKLISEQILTHDGKWSDICPKCRNHLLRNDGHCRNKKCENYAPVHKKD